MGAGLSDGEPKGQVTAMTEEVIRAIEKILARGDRAELMKGPDGAVKVLRVRRERVNTVSGGKEQKT